MNSIEELVSFIITTFNLIIAHNQLFGYNVNTWKTESLVQKDLVKRTLTCNSDG